MAHTDKTRRRALTLLLACGFVAMGLGAQFDSDVTPLLRSRGGGAEHTYVWATIDERFEGWFLLDTGAKDHHLDRSLAEELGLDLVPAGRMGGVGASVAAFSANAKTLQVGPVLMDSPVFIVSAVPSRGAWKGILGSRLFERAIVVYDAASASVAIYDPATWNPPPVEWQACELRDGRPFIRMRIEGRDALMEVDTGGSQAVLLCAPAVERLGLDDGRQTADHPIHGPFGSVPGLSARLEHVDVGAMRIDNVPVTMAVEAKRWLGSVEYDGLIGARLLCHMVVVFDYGRERIALTDRRLFGAIAKPGHPELQLRSAALAYSEAQALGPPDAVDQATYGNTWVPSERDGRHWIELSYAEAVRPSRLQVWGTLAQGGITGVRLISSTGDESAVPWNGAVDQRLADGLGSTSGTVSVEAPVARVRLDLDCSRVNGTNVIDAVALIDDAGVAHWASGVTASGSITDVGRAAPFEVNAALRTHADRLEARGLHDGAARVRRLLGK